MTASNKAMHVAAEIIQANIERDEALQAIRDHRMYRSMLLEQRLEKMSYGGWSVAPDEQEMFGMGSQAYIRHNGFWVTADFSFIKAKKMYQNTDLSTEEIFKACDRSMVP